MKKNEKLINSVEKRNKRDFGITNQAGTFNIKRIIKRLKK